MCELKRTKYFKKKLWYFCAAYIKIYIIYICGDFHLFLFSNEFVDLHYIGMNVDETSWSCEYVYAFENTCTRWVRTFALVYSTLLAMLHVWQRWPLAKALLWGFLLRGWPEFVLLASVWLYWSIAIVSGNGKKDGPYRQTFISIFVPCVRVLRIAYIYNYIHLFVAKFS